MRTADPDPRPVLVAGATGTQGGAVARALLAVGVPVRALVRDPAASAARALANLGAVLTAGRFEDAAALRAAAAGARAVFSMQNAPQAEPDSERRDARALIAAARAAGVRQCIHSSVSGAGAFHRSMPGWGSGRWNENYWESKADVEAMVRAAGFGAWTILKPAFLMENFAPPKAAHMFPDLAAGALVTAIRPEARLVLVAAEDVGTAAAAAVIDPQRFHQAEIELAGDALTMRAIGETLAAATGRRIGVTHVSPAEAIARGQNPGWVNSQEWTGEIAYPATPEHARIFGLEPMSFDLWARRNAARLVGLA